jgi:hypothetical protein
VEAGNEVLYKASPQFSLAGHNLIWIAWKQRGRPIGVGWSVSAADLIAILTNGEGSYETRRLIIDYDPKSKKRIALIELLDIYLYTWNDDEIPTQAGWTPMMLKLREVVLEPLDHELTPSEKDERLKILWPKSYEDPFIEFLYLQGDTRGWNWGRNGSTNAVFLHGAARDYFRQYF